MRRGGYRFTEETGAAVSSSSSVLSRRQKSQRRVTKQRHCVMMMLCSLKLFPESPRLSIDHLNGLKIPDSNELFPDSLEEGRREAVRGTSNRLIRGERKKGRENMKHLRITAVLLAMALLLGLVPAAMAAEQPSTDTYCNRSMTGQHNWREWTTTQKATCTQAGTRSRTCGRCGYTQTETIQKTAHSWGKWQTTKEATCAKHGEQARKCSVCGRIETRETDRKAHTWGEWTIVTEPTDFTMGTRSHVCAVCGREKTEDFYPDPTYKKGDKGDGVKAL